MRLPTSADFIPYTSLSLATLACALMACSGAGVEGNARDGRGDGEATDTPDGVDEVGPDEVDVSPDGETTGPTEPVLVKITTPLNGSTVRGPTVVRLEPTDAAELDVDFVNLVINGETIYQDLKLPTEVVLDTRLHGTGPMTIEAVAKDGFDNGSHRIGVTPDNPPMAFGEVTPREPFIRNGEVLSIEVHIDGPDEVTLTADMSAIDSGYQPGMETAYPLGANAFAITYIMSGANNRRDGVYTIPVTAAISGWEVVYTQLQVSLRNGSVAPIFVPGGIFVDQVIPTPTVAAAAPAPDVSISNTIILTGGTTNIKFTVFFIK